MPFKTLNALTTILAVICASTVGSYADGDQPGNLRRVVEQAIQPMMQEYDIPGMAIGVAIKDRHYVFNYGVASRETRKAVTDDTLFEIGSISKTFTATLASYAEVDGDLSLSDHASKYLPDLRGGSFDKVSLLNLGTHTSGGLPLQVPDDITNDGQLMEYFQKWQPSYAPGTHRNYSNSSIGMLGMIVARSMNQDFVALLEGRLFPALGMRRSYIDVPQTETEKYAQGYTKENAPIRMAPGVLAAEAYGVKSTAADMIRFVEANMRTIDLDDKLRRAIADTHKGYFKAGEMTQDLIWEQYPYPVELKTLLSGNSPAMIYQTTPVTGLSPPLQPQENVLINKTGSTNGFAAYVAFVPGKEIGIVLLANKNYPIEARVTAAFRILARLEAMAK